MELSDPERHSWDGRRNRGRGASTVWLVGVSVATRFPDDALDALFAFGAQVFSEAAPVKTREGAPQMLGLQNGSHAGGDRARRHARDRSAGGHGTTPTPATTKAALPVSPLAVSPIAPGSAFAKRGKGWIVILPPPGAARPCQWSANVPRRRAGEAVARLSCSALRSKAVRLRRRR